MNCSDAQPWLLACASEGQLPAPARDHLRRCPDCRHGWRQRRAIDESVRRLPGPSNTGAACARFLAGRFAREAMPRPPRWRVCAAAAALLVALSGASLLPSTPDRSKGPPPAARQSYPDEATVERFLLRDLRMAAAADGPERVRLMAATVGDLATAALDPGGDALDRLALIADLYGVAAAGLVAAAGQLPPEQRRDAVLPLLGQLRAEARLADEAAARRPPAEARRLARFAESARQAEAALSEGRPLPRRAVPRGGNPDEPPDRLAVLVREAARLASSPERAPRVAACADVADHWSEAVLFAAARGDLDRAELLGRQLGEVMHQMCADDGLEPDEAARFARRAEQARRKLEDNLAAADPTAKVGLQKALKASAARELPPGLRGRPADKLPPPWRDRVNGPPGKGKGKGKAKGHNKP
jgi:hypothetical protein